MWPAERDIERLVNVDPLYAALHRPCDKPFDQQKNGICWLTAAIYMLSERKFEAILSDDVKQSIITMATSLDSGLCPIIPENIKRYGVKLRAHKLGREVVLKRNSKTFVSNASQRFIRMMPNAREIVNALVQPGSSFDFQRMAQIPVPTNVTFGHVQDVYGELEFAYEPDYPIRTSVRMPDNTDVDFTIRRQDEGLVLSLSKKGERQRADAKIQRSDPVADEKLTHVVSDKGKKPLVVEDDDDPYPSEGTEFEILYPRKEPVWTMKAKIGSYVYSDNVKKSVDTLHPEQRRDLMDSFNSKPLIDAVLLASGLTQFDRSQSGDFELVEVKSTRARRYTVLEEIIKRYTQENNEDYSLDRMTSDGSVIINMRDVSECVHNDDHAKEMLKLGMTIESYMEFGDLIVARKIGCNVVLAVNFYDIEDVQKYVTHDIAEYFLGGVVGITIVNKHGRYKSKGGHAMMIRWCENVNKDFPGELKICNSWGESSCMTFDERVRKETRAITGKHMDDPISYHSFMKEQNAFSNKYSTTCYFHIHDGVPSILWTFAQDFMGTIWIR